MAQWLSLNIMNLVNITTLDLAQFNDLALYLELMIVVNTFSIMVISSMNYLWVQPLNDWMLLEMLWTIMPMGVVVLLGLPSLKMLYLSELYNFSSKLSLKVTGHQWYWEYNFLEMMLEMSSYPRYICDFIRLGECGLICLPFKMKIRVLITSEDVIHSWALPSFGFKMDACPGRLNFFMMLFKTPSKNYGQCSELCGSYHNWMPIYLEVISPNLFLDWIKINNM